MVKQQQQNKRLLGRRFEYSSAACREEAVAEAEMFDQRLAALAAERAQCGGEIPRRVVFNRAVQERRVERLVGCLEELLMQEDDDDDENLCYASENSPSEAVLGAALLLGDGKVCAWLFLGEEPSVGDDTFDPLRKRLRLRAGSSCATLSVRTMRTIREAVRRMAFDADLGAPSGVRRRDVSRAPGDSGWKFLSCLCWLAQRDDDAGDAVRLIRDLPDASCVQAAVSLARDLGFYALRASWLSEEQESFDIVSGMKCVRWRPTTKSSSSNDRPLLDLFVASFDLSRGFHVPLVADDFAANHSGRHNCESATTTTTTYRQDWASVKPISALSSSSSAKNGRGCSDRSTNSSPPTRWRAARVAFSAAVECCAIGDVVLSRIPEDEALSIEHCEALSGSLDLVAEVEVVGRMRNAEEPEESTVPELAAALLASVERAGVRSVFPEDDAWLGCYAALVASKRALVPKTSKTGRTPADLVPESSVSAASFENVYYESSSCDAPSRNRILEHLVKRRRKTRGLDLVLRHLTLSPRSLRIKLRKISGLFLLLCVAMHARLGFACLVAMAAVSLFSTTSFENRLYARHRGVSCETLVETKCREELVPLCLEAYFRWRRQVVETQISDCLARRYATLAEATTTLAHPGLSVDDFLRLPCDNDPTNVSVASLSPVAKRHVDALQAVITPTQRQRVYRVARFLLETRRAKEVFTATEAVNPNKSVTVEDALRANGWTFDRDPRFGRVVAWRPPPNNRSDDDASAPEDPIVVVVPGGRVNGGDGEDEKRSKKAGLPSGPTRRQRVVKGDAAPPAREDDSALSPRLFRQQLDNRRKRRTRKRY